MGLVRSGRGIRALRHRRGWRQVDLTKAAGVSQSVVADVELGRGRRMAAETYDKVAGALDALADIRLNWKGEGLDRILDGDHASLVEAIAVRLRAAGWDVRTEHHRATFEASFPDRFVRVRRYLASPDAPPLRGLLFLPVAAHGGTRQRHRVARRAPRA